MYAGIWTLPASPEHKDLVFQPWISMLIFVYVHMEIIFCINMSQAHTGLTGTAAILSEIFQFHAVYDTNQSPFIAGIGRKI